MTDQPSTIYDETTTIAEAREQLRQNADDGTTCPCCRRYYRAYRRSITRSQVLFLLALYKEARRLAIKIDHATGERRGLSTLPINARAIQGQYMRGGDYAKLAYWVLITPIADMPGHWSITPLGIRWLSGYVSVRRYAHVLDGNVLHHSGPNWSVDDAYRAPFNLAELLNA